MKRAHLALVHSRPARRARARRRLAPETGLRAVILAGIAGLVILPRGADLALAAARPMADGAADCRVLSVTDGDTVRLRCASGPDGPARLTGFDTPELFSPGCAAEYAAALRAKWHLRRLIWEAETLTLRREGQDRYGRQLVALTLDGRPVARTMIEAGHARPYAGGARHGWCDTDG